jgi:hypothetical protein
MSPLRRRAVPLPALILRRLNRDEAAAAAARAAASFGHAVDDALVDRHRAAIDDDVLWGLEHDGRVVAHCRLLPTRHWFGGRAVDSLDIGGPWRGGPPLRPSRR